MHVGGHLASVHAVYVVARQAASLSLPAMLLFWLPVLARCWTYSLRVFVSYALKPTYVSSPGTLVTYMILLHTQLRGVVVWTAVP
jgi:hypothetical protein